MHRKFTEYAVVNSIEMNKTIVNQSYAGNVDEIEDKEEEKEICDNNIDNKTLQVIHTNWKYLESKYSWIKSNKFGVLFCYKFYYFVTGLLVIIFLTVPLLLIILCMTLFLIIMVNYILSLW
eukprot:223109_1